MSTRGLRRFINPRQAARIADCGDAYIYDRARQQSFASERIAGRLLIDRDSFLMWLREYRLRQHVSEFYGSGNSGMKKERSSSL